PGPSAAGAQDAQSPRTESRGQTPPRRDAVTSDRAQAVVLWSLWRRRAYVGPDDEFPLSMMYAWLSYAQTVENGAPVPHEVIDPDIFTAALTDEDYRLATGLPDPDELPGDHRGI